MEFWIIKISLTTEMGGGMFDETGTDCFKSLDFQTH